MKKVFLMFAMIWAGITFACPPGTHEEPKSSTTWVCQPTMENVCEYTGFIDPMTGEYKYDFICHMVSKDGCHWETTTYMECVADFVPYDPDPIDYPPVPAKQPATLDNLKDGDSVVVMYTTKLQVQKTVLATLLRGQKLTVAKIDPTGWFWTEAKVAGVWKKGWVKIGDVYIDNSSRN